MPLNTRPSGTFGGRGSLPLGLLPQSPAHGCGGPAPSPGGCVPWQGCLALSPRALQASWRPHPALWGHSSRLPGQAFRKPPVLSVSRCDCSLQNQLQASKRVLRSFTRSPCGALSPGRVEGRGRKAGGKGGGTPGWAWSRWSCGRCQAKEPPAGPRNSPTWEEKRPPAPKQCQGLGAGVGTGPTCCAPAQGGGSTGSSQALQVNPGQGAVRADGAACPWAVPGAH